MTEEKTSVKTATITTTTETYEMPAIIMSKGELVLAEAPPEDQQAIKEAMGEIDLEDTQSIISFGVTAQRQMTTVSEQMLTSVQNKETGEAGEILNDMVAKLRGFSSEDFAGEKKPGIMGFIMGFTNPIARIIQRYEKVQGQIDALESNLEGHVTKLMHDIEALDRLYETSLQYFHDLAVYIAAGEETLRILDEETLPALKKQVEGSDDMMLAQKLNDMNNARNTLERKVHDLKLSRQVVMQSLPSIRIVQDNDNNLVTKIQSSIVNTVPLWKTQMAQALTIHRSAQAGKSLKGATDLTNDLLESNARNLKQANAQIRREVERGMFDVASIEKANQDLIDTINESIAIYEEGKKQRKDAEKRLQECEKDLKKRLQDTKHIPS